MHLFSVPSHVQLFATPLTIAYQAPLSMAFSKQEYWSRLPFPTVWYLPDLGIKHASSAFPALAGRFFTPEPPGKPIFISVSVFMHAKLIQLCLTLCGAIDCSPPGSSAHGILQARILEYSHPPPEDRPTQGSNPCLLCLLNWQASSLLLCHLGNPSISISIYLYIYVSIYMLVFSHQVMDNSL